MTYLVASIKGAFAEFEKVVDEVEIEEGAHLDEDRQGKEKDLFAVGEAFNEVLLKPWVEELVVGIGIFARLDAEVEIDGGEREAE